MPRQGGSAGCEHLLARDSRGGVSEGRQERKVVLSREYVINLRGAYEVSRAKRAKYAIRLIRQFVARHFRVGAEAVRIGQKLNTALWSRGIEKPPRKVCVTAEKYSDGTVFVELKEVRSW
jgi:large subunit ribosomal protein L31e